MQNSKKDYGLHVIEIEITTTCNRQCTHCYIKNEPKKELNLKIIKSILDEAQEMNVSMVTITGGESLLYSKYNELHNLISKYDIFFYLQTNGDFISKEKVKNFDAIQIGLDPLEYIRTSANVDKVLSANKPTYALITIYKRLWEKIKQHPRWFEDYLKKLQKKNIKIMFNTYCGDVINDNLALSKRDYFESMKYFHELARKKTTIMPRTPFSWVFRPKIRENSSELVGGCSAGIAACYITNSGNIYPCPFLRISAGNIKDGLKNVWLNSEFFRTMRTRDFPGCVACKYLKVCGGCRGRAMNSNMNHDPYCPIMNETAYAYNKIAKIYETKFTSPELTKKIMDIIENLHFTPKKLVEFGCGNGRILKEIKKRFDCSVTGVDISPKMIKEAQKKINGKFILGDIRYAEIGDTYKLALSIFDVVNHLTPEDLPIFFRNVEKHLECGGIFIFDVNKEITNPSTKVKINGGKIEFHIKIDNENIIIKEYLHDAKELVKLLKDNGFSIISLENFESRIIFVTKKEI